VRGEEYILEAILIFQNNLFFFR